MKAIWPGFVVGVLLAGSASIVLSCGYCIEDKIAAVYDHAVVTRAVAQKHQVAFFLIEGSIPQGDSTRRALEAISGSIPWVDKGTARVSVESSSLSVAFDPAHSSFATLEHALSRKLAVKGLSIAVLRIMDKPAQLKSIGQR